MKIRLLVSFSGPEVSAPPGAIIDWPEEEVPGLIERGYAEALDGSEPAKPKAEKAEAKPRKAKSRAVKAKPEEKPAEPEPEKAKEATAEAAPEPPPPPADGWSYKGGA